MTVTHASLTGTELHEIANYVASSDPGAVGAGKYWLDTTAAPYRLKRRNSGDTDWNLIGLPTPNAALTDYTSGNYLDPWTHGVVSGVVAASYALTVNWQYAVPIMPNQDCTIDGLGLAVNSAAAAGKKAKMGIYLPTSTGLPGALVAQCAAEHTTDTTGVRYQAFSSNVTLHAYQLYYVALQGDGTPQVYYITPTMSPVPFILNSGAAKVTYYKGGTYNGTLPNPWGTPSDTESSVPRFGARLV